MNKIKLILINLIKIILSFFIGFFFIKLIVVIIIYFYKIILIFKVLNLKNCALLCTKFLCFIGSYLFYLCDLVIYFSWKSLVYCLKITLSLMNVVLWFIKKWCIIKKLYWFKKIRITLYYHCIYKFELSMFMYFKLKDSEYKYK